MIAIARAEIVMLVRNRLILFSALILPFGIGGYFIFASADQASPSFAAAIIVISISAMGTYAVATTTLASRRQNHVLKRLRSATASDASILTGLILPIVALNTLQAVVILAALTANSESPLNHPFRLVVSIALAEIMFAAFALATAGLTSSPEHAQVTTLPLFFGSLIFALWALMGDSTIALWLPGGGIAKIATTAWDSNGGLEWLLPIVPSLGWAVVAVVLARLLFRWDPRP